MARAKAEPEETVETPEEELPEGWAWATVGDVADVIRGITFPATAKATRPSDDTVPCLRTSNVQASLELDDLLYVPPDYVRREEQFVCRGDAVVSMANSGALVGKVALADEVPARCTFGGFLAVVRARHSDPRFVGHALRAPAVQSQLRDGASQTVNIANISATQLRAALLPVAPVAEQRRIVAKLDALSDRSRRAKEALDAVPALLDQLRQSILAAAFRGDLTADWRSAHPDVEPADALLARIRAERRKRWEEAELAKLRAKGRAPTDDRWKAKYEEPAPVDASELPELPEGWAWAAAEELTAPLRPIIYGIIKAGPHFPGGVPYVRVTEIVSGRLDVETLPRCDPARAALFKRATLAAGDLVVSKDGTIGRVAFVPPELDGANITQHVLRVSPNAAINAAALALAIEAPNAQEWMKGETRGVALQGVNVEDFRKLPIPLAPRAEQDAIVAAAQAALSRQERSQAAARFAASLADLDRALLAKAFRGELVPQDPADKPASEMLARLRAEQETGEGKASVKRVAGRKGRRA